MDINAIIEIDRHILLAIHSSNNMFLDNLMFIATSGWTWIAMYIALLYLVIKNNATMAQILLLTGFTCFCIAFCVGVPNGIAKPFVERLRPLNDPMIKYALDLPADVTDRTYSFFSTHAANTFGLAVFLSLVVKNRLFTTFMITWSLLMAYTRLHLGFHYPGDVLAGLSWGGIVATISYLLYRYFYKKLTPEGSFVSSHYTRSGYNLSDIDLVLTVIILTFAYMLVKATVISV